jgi:hypothetical protein
MLQEIWNVGGLILQRVGVLIHLTSEGVLRERQVE